MNEEVKPLLLTKSVTSSTSSSPTFSTPLNRCVHECKAYLFCKSSSPENTSVSLKLKIATLLCLLFFILEFVAGIWAGSLAILSDSFHLLSDIAGFLISLFSIYMSQQPATKGHSWGFHRSEIVGAILSTFLIWILTAGLVWEAVRRVKNPQPINGQIMFYTALIGVFINILLGFTLHHDHGHSDSHGHSHDHDQSQEVTHSDHSIDTHNHSHNHDTNTSCQSIPQNLGHQNINITAASLHIIGDLISSIGVLISSIIIWNYPEWTIMDPICTFFFSFIVILTTVNLMITSFNVLMEATPSNINPTLVISDLKQISGVMEVHDLHIWTLIPGKTALAVHLQIECRDSNNELIDLSAYSRILAAVQKMIESKWGICHSTIQMEVHHH